jgi:RNA polymerase sigma factor (sigma-70 family)
MSTKNKLSMRVGKGTTASGQPERTRSLKQYLKEVTAHGMVSKEAEIELMKAYRSSKDPDERLRIRNHLVTANQKFIYAMAKRYALGDHAMDIVNECTLTICRNFDKYDPANGQRLTTWMSYEIRRTANEYLCRDACHVKQTQNEKILPKARKVYNDFFLENGYWPDQQTVRDLIEDIYGVKVSEDTDVADCVLFSIDNLKNRADNGKDDSAILNTIEITASERNLYETESEKDDINKAISMAMSGLDDREREIVSMASGLCGYYREYNNNEIADEIGLTAERVRQIKQSAFTKMAGTLNDLGVGLGEIRKKNRKAYAPAYAT